MMQHRREFTLREPMNETEDFLRDRVRPARSDLPPSRPDLPSSRSDVPASRPDSPSSPPPLQQARVPRPLQPQPQPQPRPPAAPPPPRLDAKPHPDPWTIIDAAPVATPLRRPPARRGWRHIVRIATLGLVNLGPSAHERKEAEFEATINSIFHGNYKVGVLGKGGVGKTTVSASVGSIFAELRRQDRVVAIDADPAFGRLSSRIDPRTSGTYWELAADTNLRSFADIRARVGSNSAGLYVLARETAAGPQRVLDPAIYREAALRLDRHFTISIIDCGSTMDAPVTQEALSDLDALIVVSSPWADGASAAAHTMEWLSTHGRTSLLRRTVVVLNDSDGHADKRTRSVLAQQFLDRGQQVVEVPFDPHLRPGGVINVRDELDRMTRYNFLKIAATVAEFFASRPESAPERH
jgi:MinD-like ATPase involved in chromosome partitioning or flagellar assembly